MAARAGRDQREPMERLVRMAAVLHEAGEQGVLGEKLCAAAGFRGVDPTTQLGREIRYLQRQGWDITNIAEPGSPARYRMRQVDNRLGVRLSPAQAAELRRAALLVDRGELTTRLGLPASERPRDVSAQLPLSAHDERLSRVVDAVRDRSVVRFGYKGVPRTVHPQTLRTVHGRWYLYAREHGSERLKYFVVGRMSDVERDAPGSAVRQPTDRRHGLHPMSWEIDPPVEVVLRSPDDYRLDVHRWLGEPEREEQHDGHVDLHYTVTHRAALRTRLYELGPRVRIVSPQEVREEVISELTAIVEEGER